MVASFSINTLQVDFESVLAMEHSGMVGMFKTLETTGLKGFLTATGSVYEASVGDFFANAKEIGPIEEMFAKAFGFPTKGMVGFLDIPKETMTEMRSRLSGSDVPFRAPSKKKEMKMEYCLLHDIVAKEVCAFDMVTCEKFDLMVAISVGLKADLGESVKLHPQKVLTDFAKKRRTQRRKKQKELGSDKVDSQPRPIPDVLAGGEGISGDEHIAVGPGGHERIASEQDEQTDGDDHHNDRCEENLGCDTQTDHKGPDENVSNDAQGEREQYTADGLEGETTKMEEWVEKDAKVEEDASNPQLERETDTIERALVVRSGPEQPAQQTFTYNGQRIFEPIQIREINSGTHFLPKIAPEEKGKGTLEVVARPNPVEEHCKLGQDSDQRIEKIVEVARDVINIEETADKTGEHQAPNNDHQAQSDEHLAHDKQAPGSDQFHEQTGTSNGIQQAVGPQPLWLRNHNFVLAQRIMVKLLASRHDPLGIIDSVCKNQLVVVSVQYGPFNTYIPIRSTTIGKSRVARDPISMHTSWRFIPSDSIGHPCMRESGESSTTKHRLLHASGPHPIPPPNDPKRVGKWFKEQKTGVVREFCHNSRRLSHSRSTNPCISSHLSIEPACTLAATECTNLRRALLCVVHYSNFCSALAQQSLHFFMALSTWFFLCSDLDIASHVDLPVGHKVLAVEKSSDTIVLCVLWLLMRCKLYLT
ncbi:hypothetical protein F511_18682 [Dorcoceras hygrometricum]|uniref:Uncharacterized protein n=1 Tax=Dorcoceras hygrometricum TaxID=472368 RepID=A0A2Z7C201_9LAMI|nr:hypothetical protein F511_18682 [Dorcoceras hygrometricum]